jgi:hypothetical protein
VATAASLPPELRAIVEKVLKKCGLWRSERADVEAELVAHFSDGLAAGITPQQLASDFGDPKSAAKLIRRGKFRNRPLWWRSAHRTAQAIFVAAGVAVLFIAVHVIRFYLGQPTLRFNPADVMNKDALAAPESNRAWPLYRQALLALDLTPSERDWLTDATNGPPTDDQFTQIKSLLTRANRSLELTRQGAERPVLGYLAGHSTDHEIDMHLWEINGRKGQAPVITTQDPSENREAIGILFPHLGQIRNLVRLLRADSYLAIREGDAPRLEANIASILAISRQVRKPDVLISGLVAIAISTIAGEVVRDALATRPELLSETQLRDLAHRFAALGSASDFISLKGERLFFDDFLQRAYTDDGNGDGRFTPAGARYTAAIGNVHHEVPPIYAVSSIVLASRKELRDLYHDALDRAQAELAVAPWQLGKPSERAGVALDQKTAGLLGSIRYEAIGLLLPALSRAYQVATNAAMDRDATLATIAIELERRRTGKLPPSLESLVPSLLPSVPLDNADGQPLRYRTLDADRYVLYSLGGDKADAGGLPGANARDQSALRNFTGTPQISAPGDLVFFPRESIRPQ